MPIRDALTKTHDLIARNENARGMLDAEKQRAEYREIALQHAALVQHLNATLPHDGVIAKDVAIVFKTYFSQSLLNEGYLQSLKPNLVPIAILRECALRYKIPLQTEHDACDVFVRRYGQAILGSQSYEGRL